MDVFGSLLFLHLFTEAIRAMCMCWVSRFVLNSCLGASTVIGLHWGLAEDLCQTVVGVTLQDLVDSTETGPALTALWHQESGSN